MTDGPNRGEHPVSGIREPPDSTRRPRLRLCYLGDAALARQCLGRPGGAIEVVEAAPPSGARFDRLPGDLAPGNQCLFDVVFIEHDHPDVDTLAILQDIVGRALDVPVVVVADWDEDLAVQALRLGAIDYVAKTSASFRAVYFRLNHLAAHAALLREHSRLRQAYEASVRRERTTRQDLERKLAEAPAAGTVSEGRLARAAALERFQHAADDVAPPSGRTEDRLVAGSRAAQLERDLDELRAEHRRQFISLPVSICRCTSSGEVTMASQELANLLGYDTAAAMQSLHLGTEVFESGDQLRELIDQCLVSRVSQTIETSWRRRDGARITVGVVAVATSSNDIDLVVRDITTLRWLEKRLERSQRMEAVGRYASEVAAVCNSLFDHIRREGQERLAGGHADATRPQGALLLDQAQRASALLQELVDHGNEPVALERAELPQLLSDLEPVLKHVAGCHVEVVLSRLSEPITLDIDIGRVERILINIAASARQRMRPDGRLTIDVTPVTLDSAFVEKYPEVRPGAHVLLQVHHVMSADVGETSGYTDPAPSSDWSSADVGTLQALVGDSGGHVWMALEPTGQMVLRIHLPRRTIEDGQVSGSAKGPRRVGWLSRLFRQETLKGVGSLRGPGSA
jgi:PAS domain S-box-containing protein